MDLQSELAGRNKAHWYLLT